MRNASDPTSKLLDRIWDRWSVRKRDPTWELGHTLRELGSVGERWVVPYLLPFLIEEERKWTAMREFFSRLGRPKPVRSTVAAADAIAQHVLRCRIDELPLLDRRIRSSWRGYRRSIWSELQNPGSLPRATTLEIAPLGMASFHANGRVREKAVRLLAKENDGSELPFLVMRLNDWVEPVRRLAENAVLTRLGSISLETIARCLPLFERVSNQQRASHTRVASRLEERLNVDAGEVVLLVSLNDFDQSVRRSALSYLQRLEGTTWTAVLERTAQSRDAHLRLWAAREAFSRLGAELAKPVLELLRSDPYRGIRIEALRGTLELGEVDVSTALNRALFDVSGTVRHFARFFWRPKASADHFASLYRSELASEQRGRLIGSALGLGEVGKPHDATVLAPLLDNPLSSVVRAALTGMTKLDPERAREQLLRHLLDHRAGVRREAARLLAPMVDSSDFESIRVMIEHGPEEPMHASWLELIRGFHGWDQLRLMLRLYCRDNAGKHANRLRLASSLWLARFRNATSAREPVRNEQESDLRSLLDRGDQWVGDSDRESIEFILEHGDLPRRVR